MQKKSDNQKILRIIDANLNRSREGLRVCEDITRFLLEDAAAARRLKSLRHDIFLAIKNTNLDYLSLLKSRNVNADIGKPTCVNEKIRNNWQSVFLANIERAKESARSLEELFKITNKNLAEHFKKIRFLIYDIEKKIIIKHRSLSDSKYTKHQKS